MNNNLQYRHLRHRLLTFRKGKYDIRRYQQCNALKPWQGEASIVCGFRNKDRRNCPPLPKSVC